MSTGMLMMAGAAALFALAAILSIASAVHSRRGKRKLEEYLRREY